MPRPSFRLTYTAALTALAISIPLSAAQAQTLAHADDQEQTGISLSIPPVTDPDTRIDLYWENDGAFIRPGGTDRHYTNGFGASIARKSDWAEGASQWLLGGQNHQPETASAAYGLIAGHEIYTPADITATIPDPDDWPYAGYVFIGGFLQRQADVNAEGIDAVFDHVQFDVGIVGPASQAEELQTFVHRTIGDDIPQGWDSQLDNEITAQLTYRRKWRVDFDLTDDDLSAGVIQLIPRAEARAGTVHVDGTLGATIRYIINPGGDFGAGFLDDPASAAGALPDTGWTFAIFGDASFRVVAHNIFLDGGTFRSGPSVSKEPVVGQLLTGVTIGYRFENGNQIGFNYGLWWETSQVRTQPENDARGQLAFTARWNF